jgi:hypothetical protein
MIIIFVMMVAVLKDVVSRLHARIPHKNVIQKVGFVCRVSFA